MCRKQKVYQTGFTQNNTSFAVKKSCTVNLSLGNTFGTGKNVRYSGVFRQEGVSYCIIKNWEWVVYGLFNMDQAIFMHLSCIYIAKIVCQDRLVDFTVFKKYLSINKI